MNSAKRKFQIRKEIRNWDSIRLVSELGKGIL